MKVVVGVTVDDGVSVAVSVVRGLGPNRIVMSPVGVGWVDSQRAASLDPVSQG